MTDTRAASQIAICLGALMCLLGAIWLDILAQHRSGRSAWDLVLSPSPPARLIKTEYGIVLAYPGTGLDKESLQSDLSISLNNALPLALFHITPLYPPSMNDVTSSSVAPTQSTHIVVIGWWIAAMVLVGIAIRLFLSTAPRSERLLYYGLVGLLAGVPLGYMLFQDEYMSTPILSIVLLLCYGAALTIFISGILLSFTQKTLGGPHNERHVDALPKILLESAASLMSLGVFSLGALWLGWYTYDTRVNLLEPTPDMVGRLTAVLLVVSVAIMKLRLDRLLPVVAVLAIICVLTTTFPLPERLSEGVQYILLNNNDIQRYESSYGTVHPIPEQAYALEREQDTSWPLTSATTLVHGFNGASLYSHIPVPVSWLRPLIMIMSLASLVGVFVFAARALSRLLRSGWHIAVSRSPRAAIPIMAVFLVVFGCFAVVSHLIKRSFASHSMERFLLLSPKPVIDFALPAYLVYFSEEQSMPAYVRTYLDMVGRLDEDVKVSAVRFVSKYSEYLSRGATDWTDFGSVGELNLKMQLLDEIDELLAAEQNVGRGFGVALKDQLIQSGAELELADATAGKWNAWLNSFVELTELQRAEVDLHRNYIKALSRSDMTELRPVIDGTVVLKPAEQPPNKLALLKLEGFEATLKVLRSRTADRLMFLSAANQGILHLQSDDRLARIVEAYVAVLQCFVDASRFSLGRGEENVVWQDEAIDAVCQEASERVLRAKSGDL